MAEPKPNQFFPGIQYLRGFAALYVVLYHVNGDFHWPIFAYGYLGVQLFFMISGFLITTMHGADRGRVAALHFFRKRFVRIYPAYWLTLIPVILLFYAMPDKGVAWHRDPLNLVRNLLLIHDPNQSILGVSWTLVYEVIFYVLFGLLVIGLRQKLTWLLGVWLLLILVNQGYGRWFGERLLLLQVLNLYFIGGCALARWQSAIPYTTNGYWMGAALLAFVLCPFVFSGESAILLTCLILCAVMVRYRPEQPPVTTLLRLGDASYSIYLTHLPLIAAVTTVVKTPLVMGPLFLLCIGVGLLFYRLVEQPLLTRLKPQPVAYRLAIPSQSLEMRSDCTLFVNTERRNTEK